ncbi:MAG: GDP-mannose 4,6-dehydratase, partial [Actinobacteria bacterium]|nr:GDP-mannose 4,6-dehydratase [Actinomycetota bacterium]
PQPVEVHGHEIAHHALDPAAPGPVGGVEPGLARKGVGMPQIGDGEQTRDFVYVDDVVDAFSRAGDRGDGLMINIGTGTETSVNRLYSTMATLAGVESPPIYAPARLGELGRSALDPGRAAVQLGWKPWTSLEEGTSEVLRWFGSMGATSGPGGDE